MVEEKNTDKIIDYNKIIFKPIRNFYKPAKNIADYFDLRIERINLNNFITISSSILIAWLYKF